MGDSSPPPSYSPPRPPPPYDAATQNSTNERRDSKIKVSPVPFTPLASTEMHHHHHHSHPTTSMPTTSQPMDPGLLMAADRPTIIVFQNAGPAVATTSAPYAAYCPKCQREVTTKQAFVTGTFTWLVCLIILFFFFPLACVPFCLDSCKDVHHYCPKCATLISIKKRFI